MEPGAVSEGRLALLLPSLLPAGHQSLPLPGTPPVAAPRGAQGGLGTSSPAGECPLWGDADRPFTLETCPQGMELSTRSVGMSRNCQSGQGCEWVQLARLVCGF